MTAVEFLPPAETPAATLTRRRPRLGISLQAKIGAGILLVLVLAAVLAPVIAPYGQNQLDFANLLTGPSGSHLFGTDSAGRDVFSRTLYALRLDLAIVVAVTSAAGRLTMSPTFSPGSRASASTKTRRAIRSAASSAALQMTMPPALVPTRTTSRRSS